MYYVKLNAQNFILLHEYPHRDVAPLIACVIDDTDVHDVDELWQRLIDVWHGFEQCHQCAKVFNLIPYNAYFILPIIFVNFVNIQRQLLRYMQQNFASFGLLCFAR